jgi:hypothetical protein
VSIAHIRWGFGFIDALLSSLVVFFIIILLINNWYS